MPADSPARLLILETSGRVGQVALAEGHILRGVRRLDEARRHARDLTPAVRDLLADQGWKPRDLHGVIVGRGPGSYTGLRVGIMSAKALAYATGCTLLAIDTFAAIASQAPSDVLTLDVVADAQQDKLYVQRYTRAESSGPVSAGSALRIQPISEWSAEIVQRPEDTWVSGPGLRVLEDRMPASCRAVPDSLWDPLAESVLAIGLERLQKGERDDLWALEPLYLRPSAAEQQWQARGR